MFPISLSLYYSGLLSETEQGILSSLRLAQQYAVAQKNDSSHGVKVLNDAYVLFQGESYAARDSVYDLSVTAPSIIALQGPDEIVFSKFYGLPSATGTITLELKGESASFSVQATGSVY